MTRCPRCASAASAFSRCDRCGLMLGFEGLTVLVDFHDSPHYHRVRRLASRQPSFSEWQEESGHRFLHVTYSFADLESFAQLAAAAARLPRKKAFVNGLEIPWPQVFDTADFYARLRSMARLPVPRRPSAVQMHS